jgi:hypothetical protein
MIGTIGWRRRSAVTMRRVGAATPTPERRLRQDFGPRIEKLHDLSACGDLR